MPRKRSRKAGAPTPRRRGRCVSVSDLVAEGVAAGDQLVADLGEVVGLAVVGDPDRAVLVGQGLVAAVTRSMMLRRRLPSPTRSST